MPFVPKAGRFDRRVYAVLEELGATIPVFFIREEEYLIGTKKSKLVLSNGTLKVLPDNIALKTYIEQNHRSFERKLLIKMLETKQSLEEVCDALKNDSKLPFKEKRNLVTKRPSIPKF